MKRQAYQHPELRDANNNIIQQGAFGKNTALANSTNDGWIDYVANDLEALQGELTNYLPLSGGTMTGSIQYVENGKVFVIGHAGAANVDLGWNWTNRDGAGIGLKSTDHSSPGEFMLYARDANNSCSLEGKPDGTLTWAGNNILTAANYNSYALPLRGGTLTGVVNGVTPPNGDNSKKLATTEFVNAKAGNYLPLSGGTMTGNTLITMGNGESYVRNWANGLYLGGTYENNASRLILFTNSNGNGFQLDAGNGTTFKRLDGNPDGTLTWDGQPLLPVGVVQAFAGTTIPRGWLLCDGSAVSRTDYAALFAVIGTTYGSGNGSTTFNLPNLVDKFVEGSATAGTVKSAGLPNITGSIGGGSGAGGPAGNASGVGFLRDTMINGCFQPFANAYGYETGSGGGTVPSGYPVMTAKLDASLSSAIYGNSTTVQPPALTMRYIIKY